MKGKNGIGYSRNAEQKLNDLDFITPLFLRGQTFVQITASLQAARDYPVGYAMVRGDIVRIMKEWKKDRANLLPAALEIQLRKIEKMEAICWEQFEKSKIAQTKSVQKEKSVFDKKQNKQIGDLTQRQAEKHVTEKIGDGSWLDKIFRCWEMQAELLDLKGMEKDKGDSADDVAVVGELVFITRTRKNNPQYEEAIEINEDSSNIQQTLIQS